jgi:hypothetical protein
MAIALLAALLALATALMQCYGAWQSLQQVQTQKLSAEHALEVARIQRRALVPAQSPLLQSAAVAEARKLVRGLHPAWSAFLLALEDVGSSELQWLGVDLVADSGVARLSGMASGMEPVLGAVEQLSHRRGWSEITLTRVQATNSVDPSGPLQFDLQAQFDGDALP